ncbi:MAG: GGDEF domain-containing protein [Actinomycetota bacterium]
MTSGHGGGDFGGLGLERAPLATLLVRDGVIVAANAASSSLLGVPAGQLLGGRLLDLVAHDADGESAAGFFGSGPDELGPPRRATLPIRVADDHRAMQVSVAVEDPSTLVVQLVDGEDPLAAELRAERAFRVALIELQQLADDAVDDDLFYSTLIDRAVTVVPGAQGGSILLGRHDPWRYEFAACVGFDLERIRRYPIFGDELFRDEVDTAARVVTEHLPPEGLDADRLQWWKDCRMDELRATVCSPVHLDGTPVALIGLDNFETPDAFGTTSIEMTTALGHLITDLLRRRGLEAELRSERAAYRHQALHDELTGLANRRQLEDRLARLATPQPRSRSAVLFVDVDDFKLINDLHGHEGGDDVLVEIGRRLTGAVRSSDLVARWGGDEFVVVTFGDDELRTGTLAERIVERCSRPISLRSGAEVRAGVTVGVAWSDGPHDGANLLRVADRALYRAKADGKGRSDMVAI